MEEEIEDLVGDVRYTDSQKSVTTTNAYSPDFTDCSSDKNHSSGKDTYILDWDDSDDSDKTYQIRQDPSTVNSKNQIENLIPNQNSVNEQIHTVNKSACTSLHKYSNVSQEIYTQTSKTIFELVAKETDLHVARVSKTLQTQTSLLSITENKTYEYKIETKYVNETNTKHENVNDCDKNNQNGSYSYNINYKQNPNTSQEDLSSKYPESTQNDATEDADSESTFNDRIIQFIDAESNDNMIIEDQEKYENICDLESSKYDSDIEEDSLMIDDYHDKTIKQDSISVTSVPKSVDNDVKELYGKISESIGLFSPEKPLESNLRKFGTLTPLTEETIQKNDSIIDVTPCINTTFQNLSQPLEKDTKSSMINPTMKFSQSVEKAADKDKFQLPPIKKMKSCPNSPNLNLLFSINAFNKGYGQNNVTDRESLQDKWEICHNNFAAGESPMISGRSDPVRTANTTDVFYLPPIHIEGLIQNTNNKNQYVSTSRLAPPSKNTCNQESIDIKNKIKELKVTRKYGPHHSTSRSASPTSTSSPDETRLCDVVERGSEALSAELLRRLRSSSWFAIFILCLCNVRTEVADTLQELPHVLNKFWAVLSENKIADLIRQVCIHVDSPRTQLARQACNTVAVILKNTNYTKKPDFYEAVTTLLTKTGSLSRPVRRAANVALDDIVSSAELSHAVTAICVHGVGNSPDLINKEEHISGTEYLLLFGKESRTSKPNRHKSALVRSAAARLLVVCCALGEGGGLLLRSRPPSAVTARRLALRSLATLLDDKNIETRKYAERLYIMLRPFKNFEAYFLTDVDVELAARQMKKFDKILIRTTNTR